MSSAVGSLMLDGVYDLASPLSAVVLAQLDRGNPEALLSFIQGTIRDGAPVTGRASGNRTFTLQVVCRANTRAGLTAVGNNVLTIVDQENWVLSWTPLGSSTANYDCFRATSAVITSDPVSETLNGRQHITLTFQAMPYARSSAPISLPLAGTTATLDAYASSSSSRTVAGLLNCALLGSSFNYAQVQSAGAGRTTPPTGPVRFGFSMTGLSAVAPAGTATATVQVTVDNPATFSGSTLAVTTSGGTTTVTQRAPLALAAGQTKALVFDITVPSGATVTSYSLALQFDLPTTAYAAGTPITTTVATLQLASATITGVSDAQGGTYVVPGVPGTARTSCSFVLSQSGSTSFSSWLVHRPPADKPVPQLLVPFGGAASGSSVTVGVGSTALPKYDGTYSVWVATASLSGSGARTLTVTAVQSGVTRTVSQTYPGYANGLVYLGEIVLPCRNYAAVGTIGTAFTVSSSNSSDTFNAVLLLDVEGDSIVSVGDSSAATAQITITEATAPATFGDIWLGAAVISRIAIDDSTMFAADTITLDPGDNQLLLYCPTGALRGSVGLSPRWIQEAEQ